MPSFNKFENFVEDCLKGKHDFTSHTFRVALSNTAPDATDTGLSDIVQIADGGGYASGGYALDGVALSETGGVAKVVIADEVIAATGGAIATCQYFVFYNDTAADDPLIGWYVRETPMNLANGETITMTFDAGNGVFSLS